MVDRNEVCGEARMRRAGSRAALFVVGAAVAVFISACGQEFEPFNLVEGLRVLAIRAEPPELLPGDRAEIVPLIHAPQGEAVSYRWSWCPFASGRVSGFDCVVDQETLDTLVLAFAPEQARKLPPLELGSEPVADFEYSFDPELLAGICRQLKEGFAPELAFIPECERSVPIVLRLEVRAGLERVEAVKELSLKLGSDDERNENPEVLGVFATVGADGVRTVLDEDGVTMLPREKRVSLEVEVEPEEAENYVAPDPQRSGEMLERRESLFMTWYVTAGSTEYGRTGYFEGEASIDGLLGNSWKVEKSDQPTAGPDYLYVVLQDNRGGVSWAARSIEIGEE